MLEDVEIKTEAQREKRTGTAGSFWDVSASGSGVTKRRGGPSASRSWGRMKSARASVLVGFVSEVSALGVTGAQDVTANERVQNVDDDVELQPDKCAVVVVDALGRKRKRNGQTSNSASRILLLQNIIQL